MPYKDKYGLRARAADARYRAKNKSRIRDYQRDYQRDYDLKYGKARRKRRKAFVEAYKATHPCVDCGETNPLVLDFDHRDHRTKEFGIAEMILRCSIATLKKEIAKCDMRCANCHRKKTAAERHLWSRPKSRTPKVSPQSTLFD